MTSSRVDSVDHVLVSGWGHAFGGREESGAEVGEVGAEGDRGPDGDAVADAARENDCAVEELPHGPDEGERVDPSGLSAGARGEEDQAVGAGVDGTMGMAQGGDIGEDERAGVVQRSDDVGGRADRGDHDFGRVRAEHVEVGLRPRIASLDDEVGRDRRRRLSGVRAGSAGEVCFDADEPVRQAPPGCGR